MITVLLAGAVALAPLTFDDVISSTNSHHPLILAAEAKVDVEKARYWEQLGAYDLKLKASAQTHPLGYYDESLVKAGLAQPLPGWGQSVLEVDYQWGQDFPDYSGKSITGTGGEVGGKFRVQVLRDLWIDDVRRDRMQADLGRQQAEVSVRQKRLELQRKAASTYWKWVLAGQQVRIAGRLVALARDRNAFIEKQVERGMRPRIFLVDNKRQLLSRTQKLIEAQLKLEQAAVALSIFYRDEEGRPVVPSFAQVPAIDGRVMVDEKLEVDALVEELVRRRPEFAILAMEDKRAQVDAEWAFNQALPTVELMATFNQDMGVSVPSPSVAAKMQTEVGVGVSFAFALQSRKARGKLLQAKAKRRVIDRERRFLKNALIANLQAALAQLDLGLRRVRVAKEALEASRELEEAERQRLRAGQVDLLTVNLRETATASDALDLAEALTAFETARALTQLTIGREFDAG